MSFGFIPTFLLFVTVIGVFGIIIHRTTSCRFWRSESYDRRKEIIEEFDGADRRRHRQGSAADRHK